MTDIGKGIKAGIINITPEQAKKMLEKNDHNRPIKKGKISLYAIDMEDGIWQLNGVPIIFNSDGSLLDGQNRLHAIIRSNIACEMIVITGITQQAFKTIDTGANRSGTDILSIYGVPTEKASRMASLIQKIHSHEKNRPGSAWLINLSEGRFCSITPGIGNQYNKERVKLTNQLVLEYYKKHKEELDDVYNFCVVYETKIVKIIPFSIYLLMFYILRKIHCYDAEKFCSLLATGEMLSNDNPVYHLREKFILLRSSDREKVPSWHYAGFTYKAWNAFRMKKSMMKLFISSSEKEPVKPI